MKFLLFAMLVAGTASAQAGSTTLLERALNCELKDSELAALIPHLAAENKAFIKPAKEYGAPSYDQYRLAAPVTAYGYSSSEVIVSPATISIVVDKVTLAEASKSFKLEMDSFLPAASRTVRPTVEIFASQTGIYDGKMAIGCRYANKAVNAWMKDWTLPGL